MFRPLLEVLVQPQTLLLVRTQVLILPPLLAQILVLPQPLAQILVLAQQMTLHLENKKTIIICKILICLNMAIWWTALKHLCKRTKKLSE